MSSRISSPAMASSRASGASCARSWGGRVPNPTRSSAHDGSWPRASVSAKWQGRLGLASAPSTDLNARSELRMVEGDPPSTTVDARSGAAGTLILNRRTRHRAIRAEHAALTFDRLHAVAAVLAIVDVTAGVRRHGLKCLVATGRTSNDGKQFHGSSPGPGRANARLDPVAAPASIGPKADTIKNGPMPPRIDLEPLE